MQILQSRCLNLGKNSATVTIVVYFDGDDISRSLLKDWRMNERKKKHARFVTKKDRHACVQNWMHKRW